MESKARFLFVAHLFRYNFRSITFYWMDDFIPSRVVKELGVELFLVATTREPLLHERKSDPAKKKKLCQHVATTKPK